MHRRENKEFGETVFKVIRQNPGKEGGAAVERKLRHVWWFALAALLAVAVWKFFLPHGSGVYLQTAPSSREIVVYVSGAVQNQGMIRLAADARLDDALQQARLLPEANVDYLNPAEKLKDGQKVIVPYRPPENDLADASEQSQSPTADAGSGAGAPGAGTQGAAAGTQNGKININTAGTAELSTLNGVGPVLAQRILQYRLEHGPFSRPEDLKKVSGIGEKTFEKMADQVTVGP